MEKEVRMAFNHAGDERHAGKIDCSGSSRRGEVRAGRSDPFTIDEDGPAFVRLWAHAIEDSGRAKEDRLGCRGSSEEAGGQQEDQATHQREPKSKTAIPPSGRSQT